ncbi:MAG TPA: ABC transporter substrate-binding protein [Ilumatobacter sp.]|nr:ABC transporter substrate-binding protein [Ilumatobacter sp.]
MTRRATRSAVAVLVGLSLVAAACGGDDDDPAGGDTTQAPAPTDGGDPGTTEAPPTDGGDDGFDTDEFAGQEVVIMSTFDGEEGERYNRAWADFEAATGIEIIHENTNTLEDDVRIRAEGGDAPDLAILPQPGLLATLARSNLLTPLTSLHQGVLDNNVAGFDEYGTVDGTFYAPPFGAGIKSIVWYNTAAWADAGYEVPETWGEWIALADKMVADGNTPFCIGIESGGATGWPLTDWVEEVLLRTSPPEVYDQWVNHEIPFNDPAIVEALDTVGSILRNPDYVGDVQAIPSISHGDAGLGMVDGRCWMYQHPNWWGSNLPDGTTFGPDGEYNVFFEPMMDADDPRAVLGGGEFIAAFNDRPVVEFVAKYLTSADYANNRMAEGGSWISPNTQADPGNIPDTDPLTRQVAEFLVTADVFRFDGSDLMPSEIGADAFWKQMVDWVVGDVTTEEALTNIENVWAGLG